MATIDVVNLENKKSGSFDLSAAVFDQKVRPHLYHAEVRRQLAERRAGTHSTKNRAAVSGGGAKPYRQKGTGRARQGTTRAPQFQGGGVVFGPVPRGYGHKLPKKVRRAALVSALSERAQAGAITVVEALSVDSYKTKAVVAILNGLGLEGSTLIVTEDADAVLEASARNLPGVSVVRADGVNVYDLLRHRNLLLTKPGIERLQGRLERSTRSGGGDEGDAR